MVSRQCKIWSKSMEIKVSRNVFKIKHFEISGCFLQHSSFSSNLKSSAILIIPWILQISKVELCANWKQILPTIKNSTHLDIFVKLRAGMFYVLYKISGICSSAGVVGFVWVFHFYAVIYVLNLVPVIFSEILKIFKPKSLRQLVLIFETVVFMF